MFNWLAEELLRLKIPDGMIGHTQAHSDCATDQEGPYVLIQVTNISSLAAPLDPLLLGFAGIIIA